MKINVSIQETKFIAWSSSRADTRCSRALNTQLPRVIAERAIHLFFFFQTSKGLAYAFIPSFELHQSHSCYHIYSIDPRHLVFFIISTLVCLQNVS